MSSSSFHHPGIEALSSLKENDGGNRGNDATGITTMEHPTDPMPRVDCHGDARRNERLEQQLSADNPLA